MPVQRQGGVRDRHPPAVPRLPLTKAYVRVRPPAAAGGRTRTRDGVRHVRTAGEPPVPLRADRGVDRARAAGPLLPRPAEDYPGQPTSAGGIKIAFQVFDLDPLVAWLSSHGVEPCYPPVEFGTESRITAVRDPDGNLVELTQLGPAWLDHLSAHRASGGDLVAHWSARR
ncbi:MAG TPA: VOC family protein [Asanoa sp.]|nr:VOC family protein [Asanoa sp.]